MALRFLLIMAVVFGLPAMATFGPALLAGLLGWSELFLMDF